MPWVVVEVVVMMVVTMVVVMVVVMMVVMMVVVVVVLTIMKMTQVHANTAHAQHAAVGEEARQVLREELANEYQLYDYIRYNSKSFF